MSAAPPSDPPRPPITAARRSWRFRRRALLAALPVVPAVGLALVSEPLVPLSGPGHVAAVCLGWALFLLGAGFRWWATLYVGGRKRKVLVAEGPYSLSRNPLYFGSFLVALSCGLFLTSLTVLIATCLAAALYFFATIAAEEADLREIHGAAFDAYLAGTPRFWPRLARPRTAEVIEVRVHGLALEVRRFLLWGWLPALLTVLAYLRAEPWWPHLLRLP